MFIILELIHDGAQVCFPQVLVHSLKCEEDADERLTKNTVKTLNIIKPD